jgi:type IX secretion system PorP/SprF family membrane protein
MKKLLFILIVLCLGSGLAYSQDQAQYSNYIANQGLLNPAYNGTRDVLSGLIVHRSQWVGFEGAPMTDGFNIHGPIDDTPIGVGMVFQNDHIGFSNTFDFFVAGSYKLPIAKKGHILSLGLQAGLQSFIYDGTEAILDNTLDPNFAAKYSKLGVNFGFGAYYYAEKYFIGLSIPKFLNNNFDPNNEGYKSTFDMKNTHMYIYGGYLYKIIETQMKTTLLFKQVYGSPIQFDVSVSALLANRFWLGLSYRSLNDIVLLTDYIINRQFTLRYSFDFTFSDINHFSKAGTHEIGLQYDFSLNKRAGMRSIRYF